MPFDNPSDAHAGLDQSLEPWATEAGGGHHHGGGFGSGAPESRIDLRRYLFAIRRYLWLVALLTILGGLGGMVAANHSDAVYLAQATVWIEQNEGDLGPLRATQLLGGAGWIDLLRSYAVLDSAVHRLKLFIRPESPSHRRLFSNFELRGRLLPGRYRLTVDGSGTRLVLSQADGEAVAEAAVGDSIGADVGFAWVPAPEQLQPGMVIAFSVAPPRDAARGLGAALRAIPSRSSGILRIEMLAPNPQTAAVTVNVVVERFVQVAALLKRAKLTERARILAAQLDSAERNLTRAERALESFRINTITLPSDAPVAAGLQSMQGPVLNQFFQQRIQRSQLERSRNAVRAVLDGRGDSVFSVEALGSLPAVRNSSEIMAALTKLTDQQATLVALRLQYTDEHPIVRNAEREIRELQTVTLPPLLRDLAEQLTVRLRTLDAQIENAAEELVEIPPRAIEEGRLRREVAVASNLYNELMMRYETAKLAEASSIPDVRVLDPAVAPVRPVRNRDAILMLLGLAAGFGTSILGAVLLDQTDRRVRYPDQVSVDLGLPVLGVIPHFRNRAKRLKTKDSAAVTEAMRGLRMNLLHAHGTAGPIMVTVGSADAGAGKTFVASNLALSFAEAGFRTLLIDADTRRGRLHRAMNLQRRPGLTDHLRGQASESDIVQRAGSDSLYFVGAGTRTESAPELLGSTAMADFVRNLRTGPQRTAIIFDSPPLAAGIDAFTLSTLCGNLVLVVRLGSTDRQLAGVKLDVLDRLPVRVLGAVINDAPGRSSYGYYSYYLPGYENEREDGEPARLTRPVA